MRLQSLVLAGLLAASACSSPEREPRPESDLQAAVGASREGRYEEAAELLSDFEREDFDRVSQGSFSLLAGDIYYNLGDFEEAIKHYENFLAFEGAAAQSRVAEERLLEMGLALLEGERLSLGIFTNKRRGEITLMNLAAWAPESPAAAEALARVGEYHFREREFEEAIEDYRRILRFHHNSEWADLATYRIGLAGFFQIEGPEVDGQRMRQSLDQLKRYLADYPSGLYRKEAEETIAKLEELVAAKELAIGDYYEDIDNIRGARYHYRAAAGMAADTIAGAEARARLEVLPPDPPLDNPAFEDE